MVGMSVVQFVVACMVGGGLYGVAGGSVLAFAIVAGDGWVSLDADESDTVGEWLCCGVWIGCGVWLGCGVSIGCGACGRLCVVEVALVVVALVVILILLLVTVMREGCSMSITVACATLKVVPLIEMLCGDGGFALDVALAVSCGGSLSMSSSKSGRSLGPTMVLSGSGGGRGGACNHAREAGCGSCGVCCCIGDADCCGGGAFDCACIGDALAWDGCGGIGDVLVWDGCGGIGDARVWGGCGCIEDAGDPIGAAFFSRVCTPPRPRAVVVRPNRRASVAKISPLSFRRTCCVNSMLAILT